MGMKENGDFIAYPIYSLANLGLDLQSAYKIHLSIVLNRFSLINFKSNNIHTHLLI